jgi:hypothetical protein
MVPAIPTLTGVPVRQGSGNPGPGVYAMTVDKFYESAIFVGTETGAMASRSLFGTHAVK